MTQDDPQRSSRKSKSFRRTVNPLFSAGEVSKEIWGLAVISARERTRQTLAKQGTRLSPPARTAKKKGDTILQCITHGAFREASAEETSPTLYLFLVSPRESTSLHKRYWQGYSDRHSSQERLSLPPHHRSSLTLPTEMITRGMWLLSATTQGGGGNLGSERNALCYHKILRTSYFKSWTWIHRSWGKKKCRRHAHILLHVRAVKF